MRIVLDTNCLLYIIFPDSYFNGVWEAFKRQEYSICITNEIISEYREIIERRTGSDLFADYVIRLILSAPNVEKIEPSFRFGLITEDKDDNKFVDCAIAAGATYIVSNDKHFKVLDSIDWPKVDRKTLIEFANILSQKALR
ncbi:MAG: putative toxin-antitoxin system toxin component, PIN family [Prevotellaceae bacterium]|nr:putative toxin-antitoxin system toxin component, PIN family [Candidatus Minthosoma caballi]